MIPGSYLEPIHRSTMLEPAAALLKERRLEVGPVLASLGLSEAALRAPQTRVSIDQVVRFYDEVARMAPGADFALAAGARFHLTTYGMWGFAILCSPDLRHAARFAQEYHVLSSPLVETQFTETRDGAIWRFHPIAHPRIVGPLYEFVVLLNLGILVSLHQDFLGPDFRIQALSLTFRPDLDLRPVVKALEGARITKGNENSLKFDASYLERPNRLGSPMVNRMLVEICEAELGQLKKREGFAGRVRDVLAANGARPLGIQEAADQLTVSERSLRRRLSDEGTSFSELRDELALEAAIGLLRDTQLTVEDIAASLGFSDAASFRRSFRRWTGASPSDFRAAAH